MYVCICNAVTEDDVHGCMASGCTTAKAVKAACGFKPGCGLCTKRIHTMVSEYRASATLADALAGGPHALAAVPDAPLAGPPLPEPAQVMRETAGSGPASSTAA
ncbi:(2Fe-2S)-binding protein [Actinomadura mexicana]|uniref:Bacterioferritin-associated ferredoxin n=1 Tax=Actinomadura mexicana TaxID=134959 RepID=A0A239C4X7_9ACTN|nr:(2Fe-2S)-binding protein [Actinomadura mexicana]SNS15246.1 Bacterioferritin-associated ferredoxin [Actinomadura mexicana]